MAKPVTKIDVCASCKGDGLDHTGQFEGPYRGRGICPACDGFGSATPQTPAQCRVKRIRDARLAE